MRVVRVVVLAAAIAGSIVPAGADEGWTLSGSVVAGVVPGCAYSPSCLTFIASRCDPALARGDGLEISIVPIPEAAAGARATFEVTGGATIYPVWVESLGGEIGSCVRWDYGELYGPTGEVRLHPTARWVAVSAAAAAGLSWTLSG